MKQIPEGYLFNPDRGWQRLEGKLQQKKFRKSYYWIYAAAIGVILVVTGSLLQKSKVAAVNARPAKDELKAEAAFNPAPELKQSKRTIDKAKTINKKSADPRHVALSPKKYFAQGDSLNIVRQAEILINSDIVMPGTDTVTAVVSVSPAKPKFKIAHVNELRNTEPSSPQQNAGTNPIAFKKPLFSTVSEEPLNTDEKFIARKKSKTILSVFSSSQ
ncbi:MAG: hypothetical protein ACJ749_11600 [Flavisolibacter sp.]